MIKTAGELISEAQQKVSCIDPSSAKSIYEKSNNSIILDVREADSYEI